MTVIFAAFIRVTLAGMVVSVSTVRGGNGVVLASPETEQLHLHLDVMVLLVDNRNLVAVVVVDTDATVADGNAVTT